MNANADSITEDTRIKRLRYRSWHRGCKETDIILGHFCDHFITQLEGSQIDAFEQLLEEDDAEIWAWLTHKSDCPKPEYTALLERLRHFRDYAPISGSVGQ